MSPTISLVTDRPAFEAAWRDAFASAGISLRVVHPNALAGEIVTGLVLLLDAGSSAYDEDELLTAVGLARALGLVCGVALPDEGGFSGVEDLLEDLCPGLLAKSSSDRVRIAGALARRADRSRAARFEYLTVSPRPNELLALLGDGSAALLSRPISEEDDNSEVAGIALEGDAQTATLRLGSGRQLVIRAATVAASNGHVSHVSSNGIDGAGAVDGARLGARLRELRLAAGLTQAELARRTGIHRPNIARVEAGRHTPSLETLARLASAIGVPTTVVLTQK
ncbi:MAG TPA: helix-turn-helix transcriptional regulator [Polyangiales bacterium]|jgi:DNA-binding XRE family transcriptional regulator|nr:helix-turn-helix transcriptional regulator [Polyangiales bacterium]